MNQLLTLSRAARVAGVTRAELQRRIRRGDIQTFEGEVAISDLMRLYPDISLQNTEALERVERIKQTALPRSFDDDTVLPSSEVLLSRLRALSEALTAKVALVEAQERLLDALRTRILESEREQGDLLAWLDQRREALASDPETASHSRLLAKDSFLRIMSANVKLIPSGRDFLVDGNDSILEAAVRSGLRMSYGCANGNCGKCKTRLVSGEVHKTRDHDYVLSEREKQMGYLLACCHTAVTDVVLEAEEASTSADLPEQEIRAQIRKLEVDPESEGLLQLQVQTPRTQTLRFMAGQSVRLTLDTGAQTELAIASCPCNGRNLLFSVRAGDDAFSQALGAGDLDKTGARATVQIQGPYGAFVLFEETQEPAVFVAFDDGIAPIKSMIEHGISIDSIEAFHLHWTVRSPAQHYHQRWCRALSDSLDNFRFNPLQDAETHELLASITEGLEDPKQARYYLAGPADSIEALSEALQAKGVEPQRILIEAL